LKRRNNQGARLFIHLTLHQRRRMT
jgi:hypothetical protein